MYLLVKSKFVIHPKETDEIKKWILCSMGKKWRTWKGSLKTRAYDSSKSVDEIVAQQTKDDNRLDPTQFKKLVTRWFTPEFQSTCDAKRSSRSKMNEPHVTGTKSFTRLSHEEAMNNNGVHPTREELYIKPHTRKDGTIVDAEGAKVVVMYIYVGMSLIISTDNELAEFLGSVPISNSKHPKIVLYNCNHEKKNRK
ncbi:uncharacterized protein LOC143596889 [Bidens hawaiensis]|uniref:uncharacterized protein LOC143596889 n=1 Tax=Bidens hawaiensis TaxID=980011 RepID=UPI0040495A12